ncbi:hypothetical protein QGP82_09270 [Leptothoe sp. LEGE 181152]|nr:hypothetical protein [Leptothoe sp. LEGE 181152]
MALVFGNNLGGHLMFAKFQTHTVLARLLQKRPGNRLPRRFRQRRRYSLIVRIAFQLFRWLFLFGMGVSLLTLFVGWVVSQNLAETIYFQVQPLFKLFAATTFLVFACACLKESI